MVALPLGALVCIYLPMVDGNNEVDTWSLAEWLSTKGARLAVPRLRGAGARDMAMVMAPTDGTSDLQALPLDKWRIPAPPREWAEAAEAEVAVVLVPCVALGTDGRRLGHGKGYYDAFLQRVTASRKVAGLPPPVTVGLALRRQLLPAGKVPVDEDWDQPLDFVVSPDGAWPAH
jgi:5-formyltetrahydrofolate cyclo-ligase